MLTPTPSVAPLTSRRSLSLGAAVLDSPPARFVVLRRSVTFVHWSTYQRALGLATYHPLAVHAPDVPWGNSPDPFGHFGRIPFERVGDLLVLERESKSSR